jgi:hypothetical protein
VKKKNLHNSAALPEKTEKSAKTVKNIQRSGKEYRL